MVCPHDPSPGKRGDAKIVSENETNAYLLAHREENLASLFELLRIKSSVNDTSQDFHRCGGWLSDRFGAAGFASELLTIDGAPPYVFAQYHTSDDAPTVLLYGHYDVQPPEPLDEWITPPYEPEIRDGKIFARGVADDKGPVFAHIMGIEALLKTTGLGVNLKVLIEGEEEIGSPHIEAFLSEHEAKLSADTLVVSDTAFYAENCPSMTTGLRGMMGVEILCTGPDRDVHSGLYGGLVTNPANALAKIIAAMHDETGKVTIEGFYDDVVVPGKDELNSWKRVPFDEKTCAGKIGLESFTGGERGFDPLYRNWARPTLDCSGITSGYPGPGIKTIIPSRANAIITMRLVHNQNPDKIFASLQKFVAAHTPSGISSVVTQHATGRAAVFPTDSLYAKAGIRAMQQAFGKTPLWVRCGASVPITEVFQRKMKLNPVMLSIGLPDDNVHSPNEKLDLEMLHKGAEMAAEFYRILAG